MKSYSAKEATSSFATVSLRWIALSESWLRPRRRLSSTSNEGGMTNTVNYITALFNQSAALYLNDAERRDSEA